MPVLRSIPRPDAVAGEVVRRYHIGEPVACHLLAHTRSDCYLVTTAIGRFVVRVSPVDGRSPSELAYELKLLAHAAASGVGVAEPIAARDGGLTWSIESPEGLRACVLFAYAPGGTPGEPHPSAAFGRVLAALHAATDAFVPTVPAPTIGLDALLAQPIAALRSFAPARRDAHEYLSDVADALAQWLMELAPELDVGPIHGDLHGGQGHVADDGTLTLFDFEDCGQGWRAYDLAGFRWWQRFNPRPEHLWHEFVDGYRELRRIGESDLAAVPLLVAARHIWLLGLTARTTATHGRWWADDLFFDRRLAQLADWLGDVLDVPRVPWVCRAGRADGGDRSYRPFR